MLSKLVFLQLFHILVAFPSLWFWAFLACVLIVLLNHVLVTFPSHILAIFLDCVFVAPSLQQELLLLQVHVLVIFDHVFVVSSSCYCCSNLGTRIFVVPSSHSYFSWSCSWCSKVVFLLLLSIMFLLLQAHIRVLLFLVVFLLFQARIQVLFFLVAFFYFEFAFLLFEVQNSSWILPCCFWFFNFLLCFGLYVLTL